MTKKAKETIEVTREDMETLFHENFATHLFTTISIIEGEEGSLNYTLATSAGVLIENSFPDAHHHSKEPTKDELLNMLIEATCYQNRMFSMNEQTYKLIS